MQLRYGAVEGGLHNDIAVEMLWRFYQADAAVLAPNTQLCFYSEA